MYILISVATFELPWTAWPGGGGDGDGLGFVVLYPSFDEDVDKGAFKVTTESLKYYSGHSLVTRWCLFVFDNKWDVDKKCVTYSFDPKRCSYLIKRFPAYRFLLSFSVEISPNTISMRRDMHLNDTIMIIYTVRKRGELFIVKKSKGFFIWFIQIIDTYL